MAARLIEPTDAIDVKHVGCVLYGIPGARKTSVAMTAAEKMFTFAFDPGVHRMYAAVRKSCAIFDDWLDVMTAWSNADLFAAGKSLAFPQGLDADEQRKYALMCQRIVEAQAISLDTAGAGMEKLADAIIRENPKNGNRLGGLSLPGYGVLGTRFSLWVSQLYERGKDLVMVAHEDTERHGDEDYHFPSFLGRKFYQTAMRYGDLVGYMHFASGKRVIGWSPTDLYMAKTPPCGWSVMPLPELSDRPTLLADLLAEAKASMGRISEASAAIAQAVDAWQAALLKIDTPEQLNALLPSLKDMDPTAKRQAWTATERFAESSGLVWDKPAKAFRLKEVPA